MIAPTMINVLLTSFPGLGLPSTLSLPVAATTSITDFRHQLSDRISIFSDGLVLTTLSNKQVPASTSEPISNFLSSPQDDFLSLRLSARLCGGKGGFGSQLRAAGGRMSSKRKRNQGENNGSNRNLDGRRLRTVTEAKALAEYLAIKPDMEKKEKDQRRKRWEQIVELAEKREEEIKSGSKGKVDGQWVEAKEEAGERTREAVLAAMKSGDYRDNLSTVFRPATTNSFTGPSHNEDKVMGGMSSKDTTPPSDLGVKEVGVKKFFGFDEDDEFLSSDEEEADEQQPSKDTTSDKFPVELPSSSSGPSTSKKRPGEKSKAAAKAKVTPRPRGRAKGRA